MATSALLELVKIAFQHLSFHKSFHKLVSNSIDMIKELQLEQSLLFTQSARSCRLVIKFKFNGTQD